MVVAIAYYEFRCKNITSLDAVGMGPAYEEPWRDIPFHCRPSKLLAPAKIQWSKPEYADEQEPPWGTSTKPPEPFDTPKQSTCKLQCTHHVCCVVRMVCVLPDMVLVLQKEISFEEKI